MANRRTLARKAHGTAVGLLLVAWASPATLACPMCKDGTAVDQQQSAPGPQSAGLDFNTSIYAMLGVVTVVGTALGRAMVKAVRG